MAPHSLSKQMSQLDVVPLLTTAEASEVAASQLPTPEHTCAHCSKPATQKCNGCSRPPLAAGSIDTFYCSQTCLVADRQYHKSVCKPIQQRTRLYHTAVLLQTLFYVWRCVTFDNLIVKVEEKDNKLMVHAGAFTGLEAIHTISYVPFPDKSVVDEDHRFVVLTLQACNDATYFFRGIVKYLLKDMDATILEQDLWVSRAPHQAQLVRPDGTRQNPQCVHSILIIRLKHADNSEDLAFDMSGAQFGIQDPLDFWSAYKQKYGVVEKRTSPFGTFQYDHGCINFLSAPNHELSQAMIAAIRNWEHDNMRLTDLLKRTRGKDTAILTDIVMHVHRALRKAFDATHAPGGLLQKFQTYSWPAGPKPKLKLPEITIIDEPAEKGEEPGWYVKAGPSNLVDSLQDFIDQGMLKGDDDHARPSKEPKASTPRAATDNGTAPDDAGEFVELVMPDGFKLKVRKSTTIMNFPM